MLFCNSMVFQSFKERDLDDAVSNQISFYRNSAIQNMILVIVSIPAIRYYSTYGTLGDNLKKEVITCCVLIMNYYIIVEKPMSNSDITTREGECLC